MRIYRWDLDKTYLLTDFDSFAGLVRSATEPASAKQAVPGAPPLLRALSVAPDSRIFSCLDRPRRCGKCSKKSFESTGFSLRS